MGNFNWRIQNVNFFELFLLSPVLLIRAYIFNFQKLHYDSTLVLLFDFIFIDNNWNLNLPQILYVSSYGEFKWRLIFLHVSAWVFKLIELTLNWNSINYWRCLANSPRESNWLPLVHQVINCWLIKIFHVLIIVVVVLAPTPNDGQNEVDQNSIKLLDLPRELLYVIFEYSKNLKSLVLVNRTLNELITQSSCLMRFLTLKVEHIGPTSIKAENESYYDFDVSFIDELEPEPESKCLEAVILSKRQYVNMKMWGKIRFKWNFC